MSSFRRNYSSYAMFAFGAIGIMFGAMSACTDKSEAKPKFIFKDAPKPGVVAKIGDTVITEDELIGDAKLTFFDLKKREYELKMDRLNQLMEEKLIGAEAKKANMSLDDFISKKVVKGEIKIADADYKKFVEEKRIPESQINPQLKERIMAYLQEQKRDEMVQTYVAGLTKKNPVEVYFTKPRMDIKVDIGESPVLGPKDAPVTIVEFSDFQCPFCERGAKTVDEIKKKYGDKVRVAFKHYPLPMHREAKPGSEASMCVHEQDPKKFWKFHDKLFANQRAMSDADIEKYAKEVGADMEKFKQCFSSKKYAAHVEKDMAYGEKLGVRSTPTFFINGQLVSGAVPFEQFAAVIDEELENAKK